MHDGSPPAAATGIVGYIDAIEGTRVAGWVWNRQRPDERLEVEVRYDNRPVARARAERLRRDLAKAEVGDGRYGFEARLDEPVEREGFGRVSVRVLGESEAASDVWLVNRVALAHNRAESAAQVESAAELAAALQEQRALLHRVETTVTTALRDVASALGDRRRERPEGVDDSDQAIEEARRLNERLAEQISALEVFIMRFDALLGDVDRRIGGLTKELAAHRPQRGLIAAVGFAAAVALLLAVIALFR